MSVDVRTSAERAPSVGHKRTAGKAKGPFRVPTSVKRMLGPLSVFVLWWAAATFGWMSEYMLPSPGTVVESARELMSQGVLQENLAISLRRGLVGCALGIVVGTTLAVISGLFRVGEYFIDSTMQALRALPILALVPLAIIWFGIGEQVKILLVALAVTFPIYLNTHAGIRGVDRRFIDLGASVGLTRLQMIRRIMLPSAMPSFFTGLRFAVTVTWLVLVVSEQINASSGIGFMMTQARNLGQTDVIFVGLVMYALLGLLSDSLVRLVERWALRWRSTAQDK